MVQQQRIVSMGLFPFTLTLLVAVLLASPWFLMTVSGQSEDSEDMMMIDYNIPTEGINLALTSFPDINLNKLGTANLDRYEGSYELTVDDTFCEYLLTIKFKPDTTNPIPSATSTDFTGDCDPTNSGATASDGKSWHASSRKDYMIFPEYVQTTIGFNHLGIEWKPCGTEPLGLRQPRYDINLYTVPPEYRALMTCSEFQTPAICQYNQTSLIGRQMFTLPVLWQNTKQIPNMPANFNPNPIAPEAFAHEGLISFDDRLIPSSSALWQLPTFHMSSFDADVISWRAMLPYHFISGSLGAESFAGQSYVYQTLPTLPTAYNLTYSPASGFTEIIIVGKAGLCGTEFTTAQTEFTSS